MASTKWVHVYDLDDDNKYVGFFMNEKDAKAWVKKQKGRKLEVTDRAPTRVEAKLIHQGLEAALAAVTAEEADHDGADRDK